MNTIIQLPAAISGYGKIQEEVAPERFKNYLKGLPLTLLDFQSFQQEPNYSYMLGLLLDAEQQKFYYFFCNKYYPYIACAEIKEMAETRITPHLLVNQFVDLTEVKDPEGYFTILPVYFLEKKVTSDELLISHILQHLEHQEFAEFAYWEPRILANIIFNRWEK
ncbi:hypothetical protein [Algivirga pacifica]|uniref:Uncharacterized protein n=1 Tax=Algivirga pacifica TaxID=1162670 RepID=A0ABP9DHD7_9BACT